MQRMRSFSPVAFTASGSTGAPSTESVAGITVASDFVYSNGRHSGRMYSAGSMPGGFLQILVMDCTKLVVPAAGLNLSTRHSWVVPGGAPGGVPGSACASWAVTCMEPPKSKGRSSSVLPGAKYSRALSGPAGSTRPNSMSRFSNASLSVLYLSFHSGSSLDSPSPFVPERTARAVTPVCAAYLLSAHQATNPRAVIAKAPTKAKPAAYQDTAPKGPALRWSTSSAPRDLRP
mmetsp:Transcript_61708/g.174292  ORF Transcript_61708/g.174292 Transcript_61708/m.174292 type:complete len:232 (-) Transcript_61708:123-818(-)